MELLGLDELFRWCVEQTSRIPPSALLAIVFLGGLIEATPFLGILVPAHTIIFLAALRWARDDLALMPLLLACTLGGVLGDVVFYALGRRTGMGFLDRLPPRLRLGPAKRAALDRLFLDHGMKTLVVARTQPFTRSFAPFIAGASRLPLARFLPATVLGSLIVAAVVVGSGYLTGIGLEALGRLVGNSLLYALAGLVLLLGAYFLLTHRLKVARHGTVNLAFGAVALAWVAGVLAVGWADGAAHAAEVERWPAQLARMPEALQALAPILLVAGDVHVLTLAALALVAWRARQGRWREAYVAMAAGPGLLGILLLMRWRLPRTAPDGLAPHFPLTGSFPNETAALAVALAGLVAWWSLERPDAMRLAARARRWALLAGAGLLALGPLAAGRAWPTDVLAGLAVGGAWTCLCLWGDVVARRLLEPVPAGAVGLGAARWAQDRWDRATRWLDRRLWGNGRVLLALIALGVAVRLAAPWGWAPGPDAHRYSAMGWALAQTGTFTMPWGDVYSPGGGPEASHHFPPLYPALLAGAFGAFGFDRTTLRLVSIALALLAIAVTYLCTRDLYGHKRGLVAAAVVALSPVLVLTTNKAYSENLLLALFVLAMWCILKALDRPWWMLGAAVFAALGYLTKSSMGYFFVVAGLGGLAWRLHWKGLRVLRDPAYLLAIAIFGAAVVAWGLRNVRAHGSFDTSSHLAAAYATAMAHPLDWALLLVFSLLLMLGMGYLVFMGAMPWLPTIARIPRLKDEHDSGLWLAFGLPLLLTTFIDAALWLHERSFYFHNVRYVAFAIVPLTWLLLRHVRPGKATWAALLLTFATLLVATAAWSLPHDKLEDRVAAEWGPLVGAGESITFVGTNDVYRYYFDVTADGTRAITDVRYVPGLDGAASVSSDWALVAGDGAGLPSTYAKVIDLSEGQGELAQRITVWRSSAAA